MRCVFIIVFCFLQCSCYSIYNYESCIKSNDFRRFNYLIDNNYNIENIKDSKGDNILHYAVKYGRYNMVKKIVDDNIINIDLRNNYNETPLFYATKFASNDIKIVDYLLSHGASIDSRNGIYFMTTPICNAITHGNINVIKCILKYKPDLNIPVEIGEKNVHTMHVIYLALISENNTDMLKLLLEENVDLKRKKDLGYELLIGASTFRYKNWKDKIRLLVEKGIDVDSQNKNGYTYMMKIVLENKINTEIDIMKYFLTFKPNPNIKNNDGLTAYDLALKNEDDEMIKIISNYMNKYNKESISQSK